MLLRKNYAEEHLVCSHTTRCRISPTRSPERNYLQMTEITNAMSSGLSRRSMLKLASAAGLAGTMNSGQIFAQTLHDPVRRWEIFEATFDGPSTGNPFVDVQISAIFSIENRSVHAEGFYDGEGKYKIRLMPDAEGEWSYRINSNVSTLNGKTGHFRCTAADKEVHGPVGVHNTHHFAYADGTPFFPFGTTCYAWTHQSAALQQETLTTLKTAPFNKLRMCIFPKSYEYNHNEPELYPFARDASGKSNFDQLNPAFFQHLERRISDLRAMGIEADLILFHPYDRWGYSTMAAEQDDRYLRYVLARLSSHRNVWWSMANEFDLMKAKNIQDFDRLFHIIEQHDPVPHLRSIHYSKVMYDYSHPWITHASLQSSYFEAGAEYLRSWKKPVVFDEVMYEGNLNRRWGNISGKEMTRRFWLGMMAGGYVTHGETLLSPTEAMDEDKTPTLWWAHGGKLRGTSPERIGFLRKLVEQSVPADDPKFARAGLEASDSPYYLNVFVVGKDGRSAKYILYYLDFHQPIWYEFPLPAGSFHAEIIDPWQMTTRPVPGTFQGKAKIRLPGVAYQALRFQRIG